MFQPGPAMPDGSRRWRIVRLVIAALMVFVGVAKLAGQSDVIAELGVPLAMIPLIGAVEVVNGLLFFWPRTAFYGGANQTIIMMVAVGAHYGTGDTMGLLGALVFGVAVGVTTWRLRPAAIR